jgi:type III restriction enzyme
MIKEIPIQPVENPILCNPWDEPNAHWVYSPQTGVPTKQESRRPAGYWYKTERTGSAQLSLLTEEEHDDLPLINALRDDVRRWREAGYRGASHVTRDLLQYWSRSDRHRRLFFCQREAVETIIYLAEMRFPGRSSRTGFQRFAVSDDDLKKLLAGERPSGALGGTPDFFPILIDRPGDGGLMPLLRVGCKMATGSGKTVVMSMLIAWAFCNRGINRQSREFPSAVLVCCPNLTVKERLQVLRPEHPGNYYAEFDIVPAKYRSLLQNGKVLVTNWHAFAPESEHKEGDRTYAVVNKGPETPDVFVQRVLGREIAERLPILVLNDEGHHCWRPKASENSEGKLSAEERQALKEEAEEARVWLDGLDRINNCGLVGARKPGIALAVDLSATPFYIKGSNHTEGQPFPWLVSDFGLVDAIESGIVKIPRLPVLDTTGRPDPKYFRLWEGIREDLQPGEFLPGKARKPKPEAIWREAEDALRQMAGQWLERFKMAQAAKPGQEVVPPVLIVVCDNTDIAEVFFRNISGEREEEVVTEEEVEEVLAESGEDGDESDDETTTGARRKKPKKRITYGPSPILSEFANRPAHKHTVRIDTKLLAEAESEDPTKRKADAAEALRKIVATVGKRGEPGEHVRCVVSVAMLTEGWDANNVTQVLGIRAFGSQMLCEQVVGRGLRRMDYSNFDEQGRFKPEYVDVYGIPFSVIPFKGRRAAGGGGEDKPVNHVRALPDRAQAMEMHFPVVEGYVFALKKNLIRCDVNKVEPTTIEPDRTPTATFVSPAVGYHTGHASQGGGFGFVQHDRNAYYASTHLQTIQFALVQRIVTALAEYDGPDKQRRVFRLQSRHQLFPQVYRYVEDYVRRRVNFRDINPCELGLEKYVNRIEGLFLSAITPDESQGEPPLLPLLNRTTPIGTTADVVFNTTRACYATQYSHINMVVGDTATWEQSAAFRLEMAAKKGIVRCYARNDSLGLTIPYEWYNVDRSYEPD